MLHWSDMSNTIPDEKVVVTYLLYLCSRLLDIRHESRAARVIQLAWRKYMVKKMEKELVVCKVFDTLLLALQFLWVIHISCTSLQFLQSVILTFIYVRLLDHYVFLPENK